MEGSTFGKNDSDWDVYRSVSKEGGDVDSDQEDQDKISNIESLLKEYAPER